MTKMKATIKSINTTIHEKDKAGWFEHGQWAGGLNLPDLLIMQDTEQGISDRSANQTL